MKVLGWFAVLFFSNASAQYVYEKVSMDMLTRSTRKGYITTLKANVFYTSEGKMASHYLEPAEMLVTNNKKGEILIYNFADNTLMQQQNFMFGTEDNQLFFFLEKNKADLGLGRLGFTLSNTKFEDGLKVTTWLPPMNLVKQISHVELVHERNDPIFMAYYDIKGNSLKKVYFYDYTRVADTHFPTSITQITFETPKDSIISKTVYSNFKLDDKVADEFLEFKIPPDAKVIN